MVSQSGKVMKPRQAVFDYRVQLKVFEGPLDLLLHLIRVQELDIYDIPISTVTDQYLDYLKVMKDLNVNLAGEYLLMASNLILIKSRTLLPVDEKERHEEDSVEDPRRELVESLLEHEKFKSAAQALYSRETVELAVWPRGECEFEKEEKEAVSATVFDLVKSFHNLVERFKEDIILEVDRETVTLESKIREVRKLISVQSEFFFSFFFKKKLSKRHLVVTFVALLELVRINEIKLFQNGVFEDIRIVAC